MQLIHELAPLNMGRPNTLVLGYAKQNDKLSRWYKAQLLFQDEAWTPPTGATAMIRFVKPDGHGGMYDTLEDDETTAVTWTGSVVTMGMAEQVLTCAGVVKIDLMFSGTNGEIAAAFSWRLLVEENVVSDAVLTESSSYFNILTAEMEAVLEAAANLTGITATASQLATNTPPTVVVTGGSGGVPYNLAFGIPTGPAGPGLRVKSSVTEYQNSTSGSNIPTGTWDDAPSPEKGKYLWAKVTVTCEDDGGSSGTPEFDVDANGVLSIV